MGANLERLLHKLHLLPKEASSTQPAQKEKIILILWIKNTTLPILQLEQKEDQWNNNNTIVFVRLIAVSSWQKLNLDRHKTHWQILSHKHLGLKYKKMEKSKNMI